ncbi:hypothetical protein [Kytococcus sp. Marseille-QA3725]
MTPPCSRPGPVALRRRVLAASAAALASGWLLTGCGDVSIGIGGSPEESSAQGRSSTSGEDTAEPTRDDGPSTDDSSPEPTDTTDTQDGAPDESSGAADPSAPASTEPEDPASSGDDAQPTSQEPAPEESPGDETGGSPTSDSSSDDSSASGSASGDGEAADARGKVVEEPAIPHRGQAYRWPSGVVVHVTEGESYVPSSAAAGTEGFSQFERYEVTLTNRAPETFRLSDFRLGAQSAGEPASRVFDAGNGINSLPARDLATGETATFPVVFGVKDPEDTVLDVVQAFELSDRVVFLPPADDDESADTESTESSDAEEASPSDEG